MQYKEQLQEIHNRLKPSVYMGIGDPAGVCLREFNDCDHYYAVNPMFTPHTGTTKVVQMAIDDICPDKLQPLPDFCLISDIIGPKELLDNFRRLEAVLSAKTTVCCHSWNKSVVSGVQSAVLWLQKHRKDLKIAIHPISDGFLAEITGLNADFDWKTVENVFQDVNTLREIPKSPEITHNTVTTSPVEYPVDVVFTLGAESAYGDWSELRIALRSIEENAKNYRHIWIFTANPPKWLKNVRIIGVGDPYKHNKDANLIEKIICAARTQLITERFIFWSDDQVILQPKDLNTLVPTYNSRGLASFSANAGKTWSKRMINTLEMVKKNGGITSVNWDSHVPQPIDKESFKTIMEKVDYRSQPGVCINTAYFGHRLEKPNLNQTTVKATYEQSMSAYPLDKPFIGYNDSAYKNGLREALFERFPNPSKYEQK